MQTILMLSAMLLLCMAVGGLCVVTYAKHKETTRQSRRVNKLVVFDIQQDHDIVSSVWIKGHNDCTKY